MNRTEDIPGLISEAEDDESNGDVGKSNGRAVAAKKTGGVPAKNEKKPSSNSNSVVKKGGFDVELVRKALENFKPSDSENESQEPKSRKSRKAADAAAGGGSANPTFISLCAVMKDAQATKEQLEAKLEEAEQLIKTYETQGKSSGSTTKKENGDSYNAHAQLVTRYLECTDDVHDLVEILLSKPEGLDKERITSAIAAARALAQEVRKSIDEVSTELNGNRNGDEQRHLRGAAADSEVIAKRRTDKGVSLTTTAAGGIAPVTAKVEKQEQRQLPTHICCLCNISFTGYGNNPDPLNEGKGRCCDQCNQSKVIPARTSRFF